MILSFDLSTFLAVAKGLLLGTLVSMLGALGPSLDAGRTVTVRALAPGDYEIRNQLRAGLFGWISLALLLVAGFCSLMGPVQGLPLFGYLATVCLLGALSCLAPVCIQSLGRRSCNKSQTMALGEPQAHCGRPGFAPSWQERGDGIGFNGGPVDHDRCGRHGSQFSRHG